MDNDGTFMVTQFSEIFFIVIVDLRENGLSINFIVDLREKFPMPLIKNPIIQHRQVRPCFHQNNITNSFGCNETPKTWLEYI